MVTPDEIAESRQHVARMSTAELKRMFVKGAEAWPPEAWAILEEEVARREREARVPQRQTAGASTAREEVTDSLQAQRSLSQKDLTIFTAELQRRSKSVALTYVLWFFLGYTGVHNFYMGKVLWGIAYLALLIGGWMFFLAGLLAAGSSPRPPEGAAVTAVLGILALGGLGLFLLWDLFTIPRQLAQREELVKQELLAQFGSSSRPDAG